MSGSSGSGRSIQLQEESLAEQKRANDAQLAYLDRQTAALRRQQVPAYVAPAPPPTPGTAGIDQAGLAARLSSNRRFGYGKTVLSSGYSS